MELYAVQQEVSQDLAYWLKDLPYEMETRIENGVVRVTIRTETTYTVYHERRVALTMTIGADTMVTAVKAEDFTMSQETAFHVCYPAQEMIPSLPEMMEKLSIHGLGGFYEVFDEYFN